MNWRCFLATVRVDGALPVRFEHYLGDLHELGSDEWCAVNMQVPCVRTGEQIWINRRVPLPVWESDEHAATWVHEQVVWFYRHEAEEQILICGRRVFEPREEHAQ